MSAPSGLSAQLMIAEEITYGTYQAPTRGYEFNREKVKNDVGRVESKGLRAGARAIRSSQWVPGAQLPGGDTELEVWTKSFGLWLKHMFGTVALSQPDVGGNPTVWDQTVTPGDLTGKSLTVQYGRPDNTGTVRPFTYLGCKIDKWELAAKVDDLLLLKPTLIAQSETTAQTLAVASYPTSPQLFVFTQGTLTIGGSAADVTEITLKGDNGLKGDRKKLGSALRKEPLEAARRNYTADITAYFPNLTLYNNFVNGTEAALVLDFIGATITGIYNFELKVTGNVRFDGETPEVGGPDEVMQSLQCKLTDAGSGAITVLYRSTDTAS